MRSFRLISDGRGFSSASGAVSAAGAGGGGVVVVRRRRLGGLRRRLDRGERQFDEARVAMDMAARRPSISSDASTSRVFMTGTPCMTEIPDRVSPNYSAAFHAGVEFRRSFPPTGRPEDASG